MKNKLTQLDVDFIGGQEPLTKEEREHDYWDDIIESIQEAYND